MAISRVKTLSGIAFQSPFSVSRLRNLPNDWPGKTSMREHLHADNERRSNLPYVWEMFGQDLSMYTFVD